LGVGEWMEKGTKGQAILDRARPSLLSSFPDRRIHGNTSTGTRKTQDRLAQPGSSGPFFSRGSQAQTPLTHTTHKDNPENGGRDSMMSRIALPHVDCVDDPRLGPNRVSGCLFGWAGLKEAPQPQLEIWRCRSARAGKEGEKTPSPSVCLLEHCV
jgi:hypothetical protein